MPALTYVNTARQRAAVAEPPNQQTSRRTRMLVEIRVGIAHVRVLRFVTDFRRKFRIPGMNVKYVGRQNWIITVMPNWKRKGQNFDKTSDMSSAGAAQLHPNSLYRSGGIAFGLVDLVNRNEKVSRS